MNNTTTKASVSTRYLVSTALMTAVLCILAPMSIPIPVSPVPISLTNLVLYFGLFLLPWKQMFLSYVVYMLLGICGLPVFSGFSGGLGKLIGPTGGYLAGFLFLIVIAGIFMDKASGPLSYLIHSGRDDPRLRDYLPLRNRMAHISDESDLCTGTLYRRDSIPPGDALKIVLAILVGPQIRKRLPER